MSALVYGISRWSNPHRAAARHLDSGQGTPLCGGNGRRVLSWARDEGEPTCERCSLTQARIIYRGKRERLEETLMNTPTDYDDPFADQSPEEEAAELATYRERRAQWAAEGRCEARGEPERAGRCGPCAEAALTTTPEEDERLVMGSYVEPEEDHNPYEGMAEAQLYCADGYSNSGPVFPRDERRWEGDE